MPDVAFVPMSGGKLIDDGVRIYTVSDMQEIGQVEPFVEQDTQPLWSGSLFEANVESYGTYTVSNGGIVNTQLLVKGDRAYALPTDLVKIGSFVIDAYEKDTFQTVLGTDGKLCDMGQPLAYPSNFVNKGIKEISNTLDAKSHTEIGRAHV